MKLYTKIKKNRGDKVYDFILNNFSGYGFASTFHDSDCNQLECATGKNRSLDAVYSVCLSKYPNLSKKKFFKTIYKIVMEYKLEGRQHIALLFCDTANRWILYASPVVFDKNMHYNNLVYSYCDSYLKLSIKGSGTMCCQDILDVIES